MTRFLPMWLVAYNDRQFPIVCLTEFKQTLPPEFAEDRLYPSFRCWPWPCVRSYRPK